MVLASIPKKHPSCEYEFRTAEKNTFPNIIYLYDLTLHCLFIGF